MKILVLISYKEMTDLNIFQELCDYFKTYEKDHTIDYCAISGTDDFSNYEHIRSFKYKYVSSKHQLSKICDFISVNKDSLDYDWYIKVRPDIRILSSINFDILSTTKINARARVYRGPRQIQYGCSVSKDGIWKDHYECFYDPDEKELILDDIFYIFHRNVIDANGFEPIDYGIPGYNGWFHYIDESFRSENEWFHTKAWKYSKIELNIIGINIELTKHGVFSGHVNI
jgi:hypothetical protein